MQNAGTPRRGLGTVGLMAVMLLFVIVGAPMVYYLWTTVNEILVGHVAGGRLGITAVVFLIFLGLLGILTRSIRRWDERLR
jgi:hypothetical protein